MSFTEDRALWLHQHYLWLETNLPKRASRPAYEIILPADAHFPMRNTRDHAFATAIFARIKELMGMADWPCELHSNQTAQATLQKALAESNPWGGFQPGPGAAGLFSSGVKVIIRYGEELLQNPVALVAVLTHELCHYLNACILTEPPATWKELEPLTDLAAVVEGYGVFLCNAAFSFSQFTRHDRQGWRSQSLGYLNEAELGYALGIFCVHRHIDPDLIGRHLKLNPQEVFYDSIGYIEELEQAK